MATQNADEQANTAFDAGRYREAIKHYLEMANAGDVGAPLRLGWMFQRGLGTDRDDDQARRWYEKAANAGSVVAKYYLGWFYWDRRDFALARTWWERAAQDGSVAALYRLGGMYDFGEGVERDEARARSYYEQAAARGHLFARRAIAGKMLRGHYGASRIPVGLWMLVTTVWRGGREQFRDPYSEQLR
ncbi:MAG: tetratricopeptide repeat protein [Candidatus Rokuibacteriota bacterium]